jgi:hypothetical protein
LSQKSIDATLNNDGHFLPENKDAAARPPGVIHYAPLKLLDLEDDHVRCKECLDHHTTSFNSNISPPICTCTSALTDKLGKGASTVQSGYLDENII